MNSDGILFLASALPRLERRELLHQLSTLAYVAYDLTKVIGIATDPATATKRCFDTLMFEGVTFENADQLREEAAKLFTSPRHVREQEWSD